MILVNEDDFYEIWSDLRNSGIAVKGEAASPSRLVLDLLLMLGYVSEIWISDKHSSGKTEEYQIDLGKGRVYALMGHCKAASKYLQVFRFADEVIT